MDLELDKTGLLNISKEYEDLEANHRERFTLFQARIAERLQTTPDSQQELARSLSDLSLQFADSSMFFISEWVDPIACADNIFDKAVPSVKQILHFFLDKKGYFKPDYLRQLRWDELPGLDQQAKRYFQENKLGNYYISNEVGMIILSDLMDVPVGDITYLNQGGTKSAFLLPDSYDSKLRVVRLVSGPLLPHNRKVNAGGSEANTMRMIREFAGDTFTIECYDLPFVWGDIGEYALTKGALRKRAKEKEPESIENSESDYSLLIREIEERQSQNPASSGEGGIVYRTDKESGEQQPYWVEFDLSHPSHSRFTKDWDIEEIIEDCLRAKVNTTPLPAELVAKFYPPAK